MTTLGARKGETTPTTAPLTSSTTLATAPIAVPKRILMGPGPSNAHPRVLAAQALPLLGHMHPPFLAIMDEIREGLKWLFQTSTHATCLISGTGHAGMEAVVANLLEPGDSILVGTSGIWGERVSDMSARFGARVTQVTPDVASGVASRGSSIPVEKIVSSIEALKPAVVFLVQGESSTGVHQSLDRRIGEACRASNSLLVVDTVASLGGVPFFADEWLVDAGYSGSQKVLSAPPGAAPLFFGERALAKLRARKTPPATYNLDLNLIGAYWGWFVDDAENKRPRSYHHTGMVSMWYAMREALAVLAEEEGKGKEGGDTEKGNALEASWRRHAAASSRLWSGLKDLGLEPFPATAEDALATVNTISVPEGVDWAALCSHALREYHLEIAGGLGPTAGKVWRVGVMGRNACPECVDLVVSAFRSGLEKQGWSRKK